MKTKTTLKKLAVICLLLIANCTLLAQITQDPLWSLPPNYIKNTGTGFGGVTALPNGGASNQYPNVANPTSHYPIHPAAYDNWMMTWQDTAGPSNMYADESSNPLFFVNNGFVYNPHGFVIDTLADTLTAIGSYYSSGSSIYVTPYQPGYPTKQIAEGWGEVCVVPKPGYCKQYYVFTAADAGLSYYRPCYINGDGSFANGGDGQKGAIGYKPYYALIDVSQPTPGAPTGEFGKNITNTLGLVGGGKLVDLYISTSTQNDNPTYPDLCSPYMGSIKYACTKLIGGSYRFLFVMNDYELIVYKITSSGITFVQNVGLQYFPQPNPALSLFNGNIGNMGELECYVDSVNSIIKVAIEGTDASALAFANFSITTGIIDTASFANVSTGSNITGLEFSPNGNYVYVAGNGITAYSYSTLATTAVSTNTDFNSSQIELGADGNLYIIGQNGSSTPYLAKITSPNSPGGAPTTVMSLSNYSLTAKSMSKMETIGSPLGPQQVAQTSVFYLPDQIDQEVYGTPQFITCCIFYKGSDQYTYTAGTATSTYTNTSSTQTWSVNTAGHYNNPLTTTTSSVVTIGEELRIPAGYNITIQNMTIKFSPQARLIIENGSASVNGAQLTLSNCTLTVDNRCITDMWPGVQVWGSGNSYAQTTTYQGLLRLQNNTVIENAYIGVLAGYDTTWHSSITPRPSNPLYIPAGIYSPNGGGLINANTTSNASFINNQQGIVYNAYTPSTGSYQLLYQVHFLVNSALINSSVSPTNFMAMYNHNNIPMEGCTFNDTYNNHLITGIYSENSYYQVDKYSSTRGTFNNMQYGIYAYNTGGNAATFSCKNNTFTNNYYGIYAGDVNNAIVESDTFKVYSYSGLCVVFGGTNPCVNSYGLYLDNGTGYSVGDNYFAGTAHTIHFGVPEGNAMYGIIANNGQAIDIIFKNTFKYLNIGSQAQFQNYAGTTNATTLGLQYTCNTFSNTLAGGRDISVPSKTSGDWGTGTMTYSAGIAEDQGYGNPFYPPVAGNNFSHTGAYDFYNDPANYDIEYRYYCTSSPCTTSALPTVNNTVTVALYRDGVNTPSCSATPPSPYTCVGCRSAQGAAADPMQALLSDADAYKTIYDSVSTVIDGGNTNNLLALVNSNSSAVLNNLMSVAPYLSDEVLTAYINGNYSASDVYTLLAACSPLTNGVLKAVAASNLSAGIKAHLNNLQNGNSKYKEITTKRSAAFSSRHLLLDEVIRTWLRDTITPANVQQAYALMKTKALELPARNQVETGLALNDNAMATNALSLVSTAEGQSNYVKLSGILINNMGKTTWQLLKDSSVVSQLQSIATDSSDRLSYLKANLLLKTIGKSKFVPYIIPLDPTNVSQNNDNARTAAQNTEAISTLVKPESSLINQPNPFKESTTVKALIVEKTQNAFIVITDMVGTEIARYPVEQGENNININAGGLNQAVMFCTLIVDGVKIKTNKMVLIR